MTGFVGEPGVRGDRPPGDVDGRDQPAAPVGAQLAGLVPLGAELTGDVRCRLVHGDFFAMVAAGMRFAIDAPACFDVILVDIDHTPSNLLHSSHAGFYQPGGIRRLAEHLHPGGVFALWSDDPPDNDFVAVLRSVFDAADAQVVTFPNVYTGGEAAITVYVATAAGRR